MEYYFRTAPVIEPFYFDSIGNNRTQEDINRPKGYPLYHYLQTDKGKGLITIQGKKHILNAGDGVMIAPLIPHSYTRFSDEWLTSFVTFTGTLESSISNILGNRQVIFIPPEQSKIITGKIANIIKKYNHPPVDNRELSVDCYSLLMTFSSNLYTPERIADPLYQRYVVPVVKEIETNFSSDLTLQELSSQLFITPQYLSKLFKRFKGYSVYGYLTIYRINKAKEYLMANHHMSVQQVGSLVGFSDTSHFIQMFKKTTNTTPLEFRKIN